tara:strand:- start:1323 stop:1451 length:129 start_codon:yes stop_codon:yes gene_type:complete
MNRSQFSSLISKGGKMKYGNMKKKKPVKKMIKKPMRRKSGKY